MNIAEEFLLMKKFLKADVLKIYKVSLKKNCQPVNGSSFFYCTTRISLLFVFVVLCDFNGCGQKREIINSGTFSDILYLRFDKAIQDLEKTKKAEKAIPGTLYLEDYLEFILTIFEGDRLSFERYKENSSERLNLLNKYNDPIKFEFQAEINFHSFLLGVFHQENLFAFKKFMLAYRQVNRYIMNAENPGYADKLKGMISIVLSAVPAEYDWIIELFGLPGDFKKGTMLIEKYRSHYKTVSPQYLESVLILAATRFLFTREYEKNLTDLKNLPAISFDNPLIRLIYLFSASKAGQNTEVIRMLNNYMQKPDEYKVCYYDYIYGEALLNRLDINAGEKIISFINCTKGRTWLKAAYSKLAWKYLIAGDTASFYQYRRMVLDSGNITADIDKEALIEFSAEVIPNVDLLKARLLFDGGYYSRAGELLLDPKIRNRLQTYNQQLEYTYRLARIYHMKNETDKAIPLYRLTLEKGLDAPFYYAANAALQLAIIYEEKGDYPMAETYYLKVFEVTEESYGARLRYTARQGIKRLKTAKATQD